MDLKSASRSFIRGDRSPAVISYIKNASDVFNSVWYDSIEDFDSIGARYNFASEFLKDRPNKGELLEVGSWTGVFASRYKMWGYEVTCLDGCYAAGQLSLDLGSDYFVYAHIDDVVINKKFDVVCAFEILEHLVDPESVITKLKNSVKPGGILLITVPTELSVFDGKDPLDYPGGEHINAIDESRIRSWGFEDIKRWGKDPHHEWYMSYLRF